MNSISAKEPLQEESRCSTNKRPEEETKIRIYPQTDLCPECGERTYRQGGCPLCISCGWSPCG